MSQDLTGTAIASNAVASVRQICCELRIAWGRTHDTWPTDWATQATDETARLRDVSWDRRFNLATDLSLGQAPVAQMRLTLDNRDQRFSPFNSAGPLYASLSANATTAGGSTVRYSKMWQVPVRLRMGFVDSIAGAQYLTMFTGLIDQPGETYGLGGETVALNVLDRGAALLDDKSSTRIDQNILPHEYLAKLLITYAGINTSGMDYGLAPIPFAWLDDEALWKEIQDVAGADSGYAFFDELGVFKFRNAAWWATAPHSTTSQATFTPANFQNLAPETKHADIATGAIIEYQPRSHGGEQIIWRASSTIILPPGETTIQAKFSYPVTLILDPLQPTDWLPISGGGIDVSGQIELTFENKQAQRCDLRFVNNSNVTAYVPNMRLRGLVLVGGPQEQITIDVDTPLVPTKQHRVYNNPYMQTWQQANIAAELAAHRMRYPRLTYRITGPALPWLQLGDMVTIDAAAPVTADRTAIVTGLAFSWQPDQPWLMTVDAVDYAGLFEHAGNYHIVGTDDYGAKVVFV